MAFDIGAGIYWRPEEGGLLWGMSNPDEEPGPGRSIDWQYLRRMERRLHRLLPATRILGIKKAWAATIEYTPDHFPLTGPLVLARRNGGGRRVGRLRLRPRDDVGPAVSRIAVDLALDGTTDVVEAAEAFRMDRFDEHGTPPSVDPVALPFPVHVDDA